MGTEPTQIAATEPVASLPTFGIVLIVLAVSLVAIVVLVLAVVLLLVKRRPSTDKKPE